MVNMKIQSNFIFEDKTYHFLRSVKDLDRNYDDEPYAYFIEPRTNTEDGFFEINILKNGNGGTLKKDGYIAIYESTEQTFPDKIINCQINFIT